MSLVIAYIGAKGAVMVGDMREIRFWGGRVSREQLEKELYSGDIATADELKRRAEELQVNIEIRDGKCKVTRQDGVLVGEVSSVEWGTVGKRRLYASAGNYIMVEIINSEVKITHQGGQAFVVLGNDITKKTANQCIKENWKKGGLNNAIRTLILAMEAAARSTPSVSRKYLLVRTAQKEDLTQAVERDIQKAHLDRKSDHT